MVLVTQSFGRESEYKRAIFSIWSCWVHYKDDLPVILFTDQPQFFQPYFAGQNIKYILLTDEKIKHMRGDIDFLHRMKIALIEEAFELTQSDLMYVDSDTFFINDPFRYIKKASEGICYMHVIEYAFSAMRPIPLPVATEAHAFLDLIENNQFKLANGNFILIDKNLYSWNAGVMLLPSFVKDFLPDVFTLTEQFFPRTKHHASEQFAFSIVLQMKSQVYACDKMVYHYWYRIKKVVMDEWLNRSITTAWAGTSRHKKLEVVKKWTSVLPGYLENHILSLRDKAIQAFHENNFWEGYKNAFRAFAKQPFEKKFLMDVLYHTKRFLYARTN